MNQKFRHFYDRFVKLRGDPREIALGFALGLFVGMTPTLGVQMIIAAFLAALLGWNKISAAAGVWITNPFTAPFIYSFNYWVGARLLSMAKPYHHAAHLEAKGFLYILKKTPHVLGAMTLGGVVIGFPVAVLGYWLALRAIYSYRRNVKKRIEKARKRLKHDRGLPPRASTEKRSEHSVR